MRLKQEQLASAQRWANSLNSLALSLSENFAQSFADVIVSGGNFLQGLGQIFKDLAKQIASMIIKALVLSAILSFTGLGGTAAAQKKFGAYQGFKDILQGRPDIAEKISEILAIRQVETQAIREKLDHQAQHQRIEATSVDILSKISDFFGLT